MGKGLFHFNFLEYKLNVFVQIREINISLPKAKALVSLHLLEK